MTTYDLFTKTIRKSPILSLMLYVNFIVYLTIKIVKGLLESWILSKRDESERSQTMIILHKINRYIL